MPPAPKPPISRPATRISNDGANAAMSDPPDIITVINSKIRRVPHLGTSLPVSGIASAEVSAHPARTQAVAPNGSPSDLPTAGNATEGAPIATNCGSTWHPKRNPALRPDGPAPARRSVMSGEASDALHDIR
ncbi:hypothetical protein GCM10009744_11250 [Kribbella alba]|uniref:Uncharacterized protein n=1 Tax=Kribbella alba TaxID=190197 RepID=A0ABN2F0P2_9ACTN